MRRDVVRGVRYLALPTVGLVLVLALLPGRAELALRVYALVVAAIALGLVMAALRRAYARETPLRPPAHRRTERRNVPPTLARVEQEALLGVADAFALHFRLRPRVREIATDLLRARCGLDLDRQPELASRVLGDTTFALVRADRPPPADRLARGIAIQDLDRVVTSLEEL